MCTAEPANVYLNTKQSAILIQAEKCFVSVVIKGWYLSLCNAVFLLGRILIFEKYPQ